MTFNQIEANLKKDKLQDKAYEMHLEHDELLLSWATSLGKARAAGLCMQGKHVLIVIHQIVHRKNWIDDMQKHGISAQIEYTSYAGIQKYADKNFDLIVYDECHHITPRVAYWAKRLHSKKTLYLSATVSQDKLNILKLLSPNIKMFKVTLAQAIRQGILPAPQIFVKRLELDNVKKSCTYTKGNSADPKMSVSYLDFTTRYRYSKEKVHFQVLCTRKEYYTLLTEELEWYKSRYFNGVEEMLREADKITDPASRKHTIAEWYRQNEWVKNRWLQLGSQRKRFIGESKTEAVREFLVNEKSRCLIFAASIEQCDSLAGKHVSVHSKNKKDNTELVRQFNSKETNRIYAVSMLTEGMNLVELDKVFMVQLDGSKLQTVQKQGRSLRGTEPQIFIFLMSNTKEEDYFKSFLEELDEDLCTYI